MLYGFLYIDDIRSTYICVYVYIYYYYQLIYQREKGRLHPTEDQKMLWQSDVIDQALFGKPTK